MPSNVKTHFALISFLSIAGCKPSLHASVKEDVDAAPTAANVGCDQAAFERLLSTLGEKYAVPRPAAQPQNAPQTPTGPVANANGATQPQVGDPAASDPNDQPLFGLAGEGDNVSNDLLAWAQAIGAKIQDTAGPDSPDLTQQLNPMLASCNQVGAGNQANSALPPQAEIDSRVTALISLAQSPPNAALYTADNTSTKCAEQTAVRRLEYNSGTNIPGGIGFYTWDYVYNRALTTAKNNVDKITTQFRDRIEACRSDPAQQNRIPLLSQAHERLQPALATLLNSYPKANGAVDGKANYGDCINMSHYDAMIANISSRVAGDLLDYIAPGCRAK